MSVTAKRADYKEDFVGDTFKARTFRMCRNGSAEDLTNATIQAQFKDPAGVVVHDFTITPDTADTFIIPSFTMTAPGTHTYFVTITYPDGTVQTYVFGDIPVKSKP